MYCENGRAIDAEGCGSTAVAAKLMAKESVAANTTTGRHGTYRSAMPNNGMIGTRYLPPTPHPASPPLKLTLNAKKAAITMMDAAHWTRSARHQARTPKSATRSSGAKKKKPRYGESVIP